MSPEIERPKAPYAQVAAQIRAQIISGELAPGDRVPSVRDVAANWGIARATAEKALGLLREQGLIITRDRSGAVVAADAPIYRSLEDRQQQVARTGLIYTPGEYAVIIAAEQVSAPDDVAHALDLEPGATAVRRHRVTHRDGQPRSSSTSWFAGDLATTAPLLLQRERIRQGTPRYVEECTGRQAGPVRRHEVLARLATAVEAEELGLSTPAAVLESRHTILDTADRPLTFEVGLARPGDILTISTTHGSETR